MSEHFIDNKGKATQTSPRNSLSSQHSTSGPRSGRSLVQNEVFVIKNHLEQSQPGLLDKKRPPAQWNGKTLMYQGEGNEELIPCYKELRLNIRQEVGNMEALQRNRVAIPQQYRWVVRECRGEPPIIYRKYFDTKVKRLPPLAVPKPKGTFSRLFKRS